MRIMRTECVSSGLRVPKSFHEMIHADRATKGREVTGEEWPHPEEHRAMMAGRHFAERHRKAVEEALKGGKPVPPEVLSDYPDLTAKK